MIRKRFALASTALILAVQAQNPAQSPNPEETPAAAAVISSLSALEPDQLDRGLQIIDSNVRALSPQLCQELIGKANRFYRSSDFDRSALFFELSREAAVRSGNKAVLVHSFINRLGVIYFDRDQTAKAIDADLRSKKIFEDLGSAIDLIFLLGDLGRFYRSTGDYESARAYSLRCLELCSSQENGDGTGFVKELGLRLSWNNLAWISASQGDFTTAISHLTRSVELSRARRAASPDWLADDLIDLSRICRAMGDYRQALSLITEALAIAEALSLSREPGASSPTFVKPILNSAYNGLGLLYLYQGDYSSAVKWLSLSRDLCAETGNKRGFADALSNLGDAYLAQRNTAAAIKTYQQALAAAQSVGYADSIVTIRHGLALAHRAGGDNTTALSDLEDAGRVAEHLGDKNRLAETYCFKGEVYYSMGDFGAANYLADKAYEIAEHLPRPRPMLWSLSLKGKASLAQQRADVARAAIQHAIDTVEGMRASIGTDDAGRAQFMEGRQIEPYRLMMELLLRDKDTPGALAVAEQAKGRALLDILRTGRENIASVMTAAERERDIDLNSKVASLNKKIYAERQRPQPDTAVTADTTRNLEKTRREYELFRDGLYSAHLEFGGQGVGNPKFDLSHVADTLLIDETASLEFIVSDDITHVFVVRWDKVKNGSLPSAPWVNTYSVNVSKKELTELVNTFVEQLGNPHYGKDAAARHLYDLLLAPAKELLAGESSLAIVPDGILWNLPFQALKQSTGKYLVEDYSIFYAPSLTVLAEMVKRTKGRQYHGTPGIEVQNVSNVLNDSQTDARPATDDPAGTLLALGDPTLTSQVIERARSSHRDEGLAPLPDAQREVTALRGLYDRGRSTIYVGVEAREDRVKAEVGKYGVLHFATHGILDSTSPMYSHIVLATDDKSPDDGLLEAWEIMRLNLKADLAVLSACDTARGKTEAGEGVIGMSWAFFVAGCPTTVVSQWKVDSASTADLMIEFHRRLVQKTQAHQRGWRKAQALREAMLNLMKNPQYRDPYYWAGFVVVGAG